MSIVEFNKTGWGSNMRCLYSGIKYDIESVNFPEALLGLTTEFEDEPLWVRCENIEII